MKQKKETLLFIGFFLLLVGSLAAQRNTVATGGEATGSGGTISYTVGQIDYTQAEGSGGIITMGVQQPFEIFVLGTDDHPDISIEIAVFPNPTPSNPTLKFGETPYEEIRIGLYDIMGRSIYESSVFSEETTIPMENLASATYILRVSTTDRLLKTFKIIKK